MDVSAQTLREVEFREKLRGYHPDDVDEFLERVAAGIEHLQDRLRQATERAQRAETQAAETHDGDDALKRTLVLAQRTAEMAVQEARQEADRIAASARAEANAIVAQAEDMARRTIEETQGGIRAELTQLETARDRLRTDITALEHHLDAERMRLRASLAEALQAVETTLAPAPPAPVTTDVTIPPRRVPKAPALPEIDPSSLVDPAAGEPERFEIEPEDVDRVSRVADGAVAEPPSPPRLPPPPPAPAAPTSPPSVEDERRGLGVDGLFDDLADDSIAAAPARSEPDPWGIADAWAEPAAAPVWAAPEPADAPAAESAPAPLFDGGSVPQDDDEEDSDDEVDEDPFIAELRRAITDTQPLGPREEGDLNPEAHGDDLVHGDVLDGSRLGSLLRRRR